MDILSFVFDLLQDPKTIMKQNDEADNSDTWNDSQISDSSLKQKVRKDLYLS